MDSFVNEIYEVNGVSIFAYCGRSGGGPGGFLGRQSIAFPAVSAATEYRKE